MVVPKGGKKRSAATKLESQPKRRSAEKEIPEVTSKLAEKKRSRPVTHAFPIVEESDSDLDEGGSENWKDVDEEEEDGAMDDEPLIDEDAMDVDEAANVDGKAKIQKDSNGVWYLCLIGILHNQYAKPPENLTKPKKPCWSNARRQSLIQRY